MCVSNKVDVNFDFSPLYSKPLSVMKNRKSWHLQKIDKLKLFHQQMAGSTPLGNKQELILQLYHLIKEQGVTCYVLKDKLPWSPWFISSLTPTETGLIDVFVHLILVRIWKTKALRRWLLKCRKIPKISPGAYIFQRLIFGGAYLWMEICVSKSVGLAL